ncbi:UvrB/UvrC motif-containing protein, partial [Hydrogenivirga sp. 128-5-R1-1]|uniref:UvrB/UvrC motif-containing protein n=1 Tax=Hydrogenivirga sp. 128-5-R1-1 TaxID=392423 RepID=UPI00015EF75E
KLQEEYNKNMELLQNNKKEIKDVINLEEVGIKIYEDIPDNINSEEDLLKEIEKLEKQMWEYAKNWEFEKAAQIRDKIEKLKKAAVSL